MTKKPAKLQCKPATDGRARNRDRSEWIDTGRRDVNGHPIYALPDDVKLMRGVVVTESGCWERRGSHNGPGYPTLRAFGERYGHRASWVMHNGPIPDGLFVCHKCDNPPCINPDHLFLGDNGDNMRDMRAKGRGFPARVHWRKKQTADALIEDARKRWAAGETQKSIGASLGVDASTVSRWVTGQKRTPPGTQLPQRERREYVCRRGHDWSVTPPYLAHRRDGSVSRRCRVCQSDSERARRAT